MSFKRFLKTPIYSRWSLISTFDLKNQQLTFGGFQPSLANKHILFFQLFRFWRSCRSIWEASKSNVRKTIQNLTEFLEWCCPCPCSNQSFPSIDDYSEGNPNLVYLVVDWSFECLANRIIDLYPSLIGSQSIF